MLMIRIMLLIVIVNLACAPAWAQKGGRPKCTNLPGHITLEDTGAQIRSDGLGAYLDGQAGATVTLWTCPGESGDAVINLLVANTTRRIVRDFSTRIPVSPVDDPLPSWYASAPVQVSRGGFNIRHILKGYDPANGYAPGYPVASCWDGSSLAPVCEFTTTATSNFDANNNQSFYLRFQNPQPDLEDNMNPEVQALLNEEYELALIRVRYYPDPSDRRRDYWEAQPAPDANGRNAGGMFEITKNVIRRLGYFDMNFKVSIRRADGQP